MAVGGHIQSKVDKGDWGDQNENCQTGGNAAQPKNMAMNPEIWRDIFDAIEDPAFLHDTQFRVLLGKPYWEAFPPGTDPLPGCKDAYV